VSRAGIRGDEASGFSSSLSRSFSGTWKGGPRRAVELLARPAPEPQPRRRSCPLALPLRLRQERLTGKREFERSPVALDPSVHTRTELRRLVAYQLGEFGGV
jgi:hypothetical protein